MFWETAPALRRALEKTCASDPAGATAIIQAALRQSLGKGTGLPGGALSKGAKAPDFAGLCGECSGLTGGLASSPGLRRSSPAPQVPDGARYEHRHFANAAGARDYRLLVPDAASRKPKGLVMMLHGCTQSPDDFAVGTRMNRRAGHAGYLVAYPGQTQAHNPQSCWNWFRPEDQRRGAGEPAVLAGLAQALMAEFDLPAGSAFVAGLSAGGAMAAILAEAYPDLFAAAGVHSGLPPGAARDLPSAFAAMRGQGQATRRSLPVPLIVFHGDGDGVVAPRNGEELVAGGGVETAHSGNGRQWRRLVTEKGSELWRVAGAGHAWFGGDGAGSHSDPLGPDASAEMLRFFQARFAREGA